MVSLEEQRGWVAIQLNTGYRIFIRSEKLSLILRRKNE